MAVAEMAPGGILEFAGTAKSLQQQVLLGLGETVRVEIVRGRKAAVDQADFQPESEKDENLQGGFEVFGGGRVEDLEADQFFQALQSRRGVETLFEEEHPDAVDDEHAAGLLQGEHAFMGPILLENETSQQVDGRSVIEVVLQQVVKKNSIAAQLIMKDFSQVLAEGRITSQGHEIEEDG